jgi:hypothetical protein
MLSLSCETRLPQQVHNYGMAVHAYLIQQVDHRHTSLLEHTANPLLRSSLVRNNRTNATTLLSQARINTQYPSARMTTTVRECVVCGHY